MIAIYINLFLFGMFIGSFYNVVALRLCKNESILFPGSHCTNCNHRLTWYELIPVFSYIGLHGKCRKCKVHISWQYPIVELLTGVLFAFSFYLYGFTLNTLISIVLSSVCIITFVTDLKYMVILDEILVISILFLSVIYYFYDGVSCLFNHLGRGLFLFLVLLLIKVFGDKAFKQESLGWGDVKLSFLAGMVLGIRLGLVYIFVGALLAFPYGCYMSVKKSDSIVPFGPFLVTSLMILFWNNEFVLNLFKMLLGV